MIFGIPGVIYVYPAVKCVKFEELQTCVSRLLLAQITKLFTSISPYENSHMMYYVVCRKWFYFSGYIAQL
jgi:hypothetical protein